MEMTTLLRWLWGELRNPKTVDTPLRRRRLEMELTREALARRCRMPRRTLEGYEQGIREPHGARLSKLMRVTGLPAEALIFPGQYLAAHPDFLIAYAMKPSERRPRPTKD